ncbi:hypothetical protein STENM327S_01697 [Streptomyces tendae]
MRHGSEVLGSLWAAADGRPLAEDAAAALHTAARAAVPHLSHHQTWGRAAARAREGAVHALLDGSGQAARAAHEAGVAPGRPYTVMVAEAYDSRDLTGVPAAAAGGAAEQRVLDVLALQAAAYRPGCVTARSLPVVEPGDVVASPATPGAYFFSSHFSYNSLPRPAVYGYRTDSGGRVAFALVREAQSVRDVVEESGLAQADALVSLRPDTAVAQAEEVAE